MNKIYVDRSRYESSLRCMRARFHGYHDGPEGIGLAPVKRSLPLAVGGSVHVGLATLLRDGQKDWNISPQEFDSVSLQREQNAVAAALADFAEYRTALELPDLERAATASPAPNPLAAQLEDSLGYDSTTTRAEAAVAARSDIDEYLYIEQASLVEAMIRAYARRRLRPLLEEFEVLEVEREGEWLLAEGGPVEQAAQWGKPIEIWFMSRPDALLRHRESNALYLQSYKTTAQWDVRKARDAEHDMQGISEGVEVDRRLGRMWEYHHGTSMPEPAKEYGLDTHADSPRLWEFIEGCDEPPRILGVRYEYLLKGERWKDKELSERFGCEMRSQKSHLIRRYEAISVPMRGAAGYSIGDVCWSWDFVRDDGRPGSLAWQNWKSRPVWDAPGGVRAWIDALDSSAPTMSAEDPTVGLEPRELGYKSDAQAVGYTAQHPLDAAFLPPMMVYRNLDEPRDLVDQMEAHERRVAEGVVAVAGAADEGERRHLLNVHFPQTRTSCEFPSTCSFSKICWSGEEVRRDPLASGLYAIRVPNHPIEGSK